MSFQVTYPPLKRAELARAVRAGDHHARGQHTQLDQAREYIAEVVEHTGTPESHVALDVSGSHIERGGVVTVYQEIVIRAEVVHGAEVFDNPASNNNPAGEGAA